MVSLSTSAFYDRSLGQMNALRVQAEDLNRQIISQERLSRSSDDPVAAARLRTLNRGERLAQIDQSNSDTAQTDLKLTDSALGSIATAILQAQELAVRAGGTLSAEQRAAVGQEIAGLRETLLNLANARSSGGHALFGGQTTGDAYSDTGTGAIYIGTGSVDPANLGEGQTVLPGFTGPEVFSIDVNGTTTDLFTVLGNLAAALQGGGDTSAATQDALAGLESGLTKVSTAQTMTGARLNWIEMMDNRRETTGELVAEEKATVGGADIASTMVRLQEAMTVLEASQASFVQLSNLSLFNILR